jgi:hypothetical protein
MADQMVKGARKKIGRFLLRPVLNSRNVLSVFEPYHACANRTSFRKASALSRADQIGHHGSARPDAVKPEH